ncbi:hypothetical protein ACVWYN_001248 [Pedobacter sp. UYP24]
MKNIILQPKTAKYKRGLGIFIWFTTLSLLLLSCSKINDSTKMDISLSPTITKFDIPINSSLAIGNTIAEITTAVNLDSLIKVQAPRFSTSNITSMKMTSFTLSLTDSVEVENNFANIANIDVSVQGGGQNSNTIASLSNGEAMAGVLSIPIRSTDNDLRPFLNDGQVKYLLIGKLRKETTKILKAKATVTYRLQLKL